MMIFQSKRKFSRVTFAATIGMALVIGCASGARAADDDEEEVLLDTKIVRGILKGLGLRKDEASIEYRERSPLVLPPTSEAKQLRPPEDAKAKKTVAWPDDPDIKRVKQRKDADRNRKAYVEGVDDRPLLPSQLGRGATGKPDNASGPTTDQTSAPSSWSELGSKNIFTNFWGTKEEYVPFTGEPPRTSLLEPPAGYRTPSPAQPFGVGPQKPDYKPIDRQVPAR
jgi:hypothetical protein